MRLSIPSILQGSLGSLIQRAIGGVNALVATLWPYTYGTGFRSNTVLTANTAETVLAAGSNTNGAIIWSADYRSQLVTTSPPTPLVALVIHTAAPTAINQGQHVPMGRSWAIIALADYMESFGWMQGGPVLVPAGSGIYFIKGALENAGERNVLYTNL